MNLEIESNKIVVSQSILFTNDTAHLSAIVSNNSNQTIVNAQVALIIDGVTYQTKIITLNPFVQAPINFDWIAKWGQDTIMIKADPSDFITEANENNNTGTKYIFVNDIYAPQILETIAVPNPAYISTQVLFKVKAVDSTGIASVKVSWQNQTATLVYKMGILFK